jgi:hypothetical protein
MMVTKAHILDEIERTAEANGGRLLVVKGFMQRRELRKQTGPESTGFAGAMRFGRRDMLRISFSWRTMSGFFSKSWPPLFKSLVISL